jgi:hypothetical protein
MKKLIIFVGLLIALALPARAQHERVMVETTTLTRQMLTNDSGAAIIALLFGSTNFGGLISLDGLTQPVQTFAAGANGSDFNITSDGISQHIFNIPTATASARGLLSAADWARFNANISGVTNLATATTTGLLRSNDWVTFNAGSGVGKLAVLNNLSDVNNAVTALANIGGTSSNGVTNILISATWTDQKILGGALELFGNGTVATTGRLWMGEPLGDTTNLYRFNIGSVNNSDDTTVSIYDKNGFTGITFGSITADSAATLGYGQQMVVGMYTQTNAATQASSFWGTNVVFLAPNSRSVASFTSQNNVATIHLTGSGNDALTINTTATSQAPFGTMISSAVVGNNPGSGYVTGDLIALQNTNVTQRYFMGRVSASGGAVTAITVVNMGQLTNSVDVQFFSYQAPNPGTSAAQTQHPISLWDTHKGTWQMIRGWANGATGYSSFNSAPIGGTFDGKYGYLDMATSASNTFNATGTITASGRTITGSGTAFLSQLRPGMLVGVGSDSAIIISVASDTSATTLATFNESAGSTLVIFPNAFEAYGIVTGTPYDITSEAVRVNGAGNLSIISPGASGATEYLSSGGKSWTLTAGSDGHFTLNSYSSSGGAAAMFLDYATPNGWLESDSTGNIIPGYNIATATNATTVAVGMNIRASDLSEAANFAFTGFTSLSTTLYQNATVYVTNTSGGVINFTVPVNCHTNALSVCNVTNAGVTKVEFNVSANRWTNAISTPLF